MPTLFMTAPIINKIVARVTPAAITTPPDATGAVAAIHIQK